MSCVDVICEAFNKKRDVNLAAAQEYILRISWTRIIDRSIISRCGGIFALYKGIQGDRYRLGLASSKVK